MRSIAIVNLSLSTCIMFTGKVGRVMGYVIASVAMAGSCSLLLSVVYEMLAYGHCSGRLGAP